MIVIPLLYTGIAETKINTDTVRNNDPADNNDRGAPTAHPPVSADCFIDF